ncbi:MAG: hypothetical protein MJZ64_07975 [Paludibacteraceae bacterium]|nr:hypothetical protein [Paludibacteraceae bacterium]
MKHYLKPETQMVNLRGVEIMIPGMTSGVSGGSVTPETPLNPQTKAPKQV